MGKKWDKFLATVKGAAHKTKKQVVKTVDVAQQKNAISRKKRSLNELYAEIGLLVCNSCNNGELRLNGAGAQSTIEWKDRVAELVELEADFKDEIERMEKMLHWLQTHDRVEKEEKKAQEDTEASVETEESEVTEEVATEEPVVEESEVKSTPKSKSNKAKEPKAD